MRLKKGSQIAYIPNHADGDINHKDVQYGFVMSVKPNGIFCRFFTNKKGGFLRTTANSELCSEENLVECETYSNEFIAKLIKSIEYEIEHFRGRE